ncbi:serine/threonine-protein kinase pim-2-like [Invertebrate iridescent virus 22]|uniref:Serine/threonine-protein kinase pim-2-like n=1 Tax=Invertebrate iridescent virus 22 TaxID=345198 RepID=S6DAZ9_9VIRU|nr:serine/threonine-protein kinase pim-2-like [Invertebrate iridescent virus 22]CCV01811.1 serine/threonine-protein kinase pim-2-like [Invertebrate iridescent virus 22]
MVMSLFADEFAEKTVKKYINQGIWLECSLSDYYTYLEYYDEGGYGSIHRVMDRFTGKHKILKRSSKKDFVKGHLKAFYTQKYLESVKIGSIQLDENLYVSQEAEFMVQIHQKLGGLELFDYYDDDDHYILIMEDGGRSLESIACSHRKKIIDLIRYKNYQTNFFYHTYLKQISQYLIKIYHQIKDIHDLGIHHNDLKPENILVCGEKITIIDYGVAKKVEKSYTSYHGTLEYVPFEFVKNGSYKPWDHTIWCFGIMLHFLTLMKYPFIKEEEVLDYNLDYLKINKLPQSFSNLIFDCLQKNPLNRPQNLLERLENLESY